MSSPCRISPSAAGSQSRTWRRRAAAPRPSADTVTRRACRCPCPVPRPSQTPVSTERRRSAPSHWPHGTSTEPRWRARADSRRASLPRTRSGGATTTRSRASSRAATITGHSGPGAGTSASRSSATPISAAATAPSDPKPTTAHQDPACDGPAMRARIREVDPCTATVVPRCNPSRGSRLVSGGSTGSDRSPSMPGRPVRSMRPVSS
jgi:hypothetical protein